MAGPAYLGFLAMARKKCRDQLTLVSWLWHKKELWSLSLTLEFKFACVEGWRLYSLRG